MLTQEILLKSLKTKSLSHLMISNGKLSLNAISTLRRRTFTSELLMPNFGMVMNILETVPDLLLPHLLIEFT